MPQAASPSGSTSVAFLPAGSPKPARKIIVLAGTPDFAARGEALLPQLRDLAREVVVIAPAPMQAQLEALGASVIAFDPQVASGNVPRETLASWRLARILEAEAPDIVHATGARAAVLCGLAARFGGGAVRTILHIPDLEALEPPGERLPRLYRRSPAKMIGTLASRPETFLLVERAGDVAELRARGIEPGPRVAVVSGPGIDPDSFPLLPPPQGDIPVAACVTPAVEGGGLDTLMQAFDRAWSRGVRLHLELAGAGIEGRHDAADSGMARWRLHPGVLRSEPVIDAREVWRRADICVLPVERRQALPRALLEAAACGRPLIVTEGADGASFVRDDVEGLIVPPGDVAALSTALERLARDAELRWRLGHAARVRVLHGFTDAHVRETVKGAYLGLLG